MMNWFFGSLRGRLPTLAPCGASAAAFSLEVALLWRKATTFYEDDIGIEGEVHLDFAPMEERPDLPMSSIAVG
jgi:hypothetical protein